MEQLTGAAIGSVVVLAYVLVVQAMTAASLLLAQFVVAQARSLWSMFTVEFRPEYVRRVPESQSPEPVPDHQIVIGGGIRKWD